MKLIKQLKLIIKNNRQVYICNKKTPNLKSYGYKRNMCMANFAVISYVASKNIIIIGLSRRRLVIWSVCFGLRTKRNCISTKNTRSDLISIIRKAKPVVINGFCTLITCQNVVVRALVEIKYCFDEASMWLYLLLGISKGWWSICRLLVRSLLFYVLFAAFHGLYISVRRMLRLCNSNGMGEILESFYFQHQIYIVLKIENLK